MHYFLAPWQKTACMSLTACSEHVQGCTEVTAVDPNPAMQPYAREVAAQHGLQSFTVVQGAAEELPFDDNSFDRVVCTLVRAHSACDCCISLASHVIVGQLVHVCMQVLCSVEDVPAAISEIKRVLRDGGKYLFLEHVAAGRDRPVLRAAQSVLTPLQSILADGCHLNREAPLEVMQQAGFTFQKQKRFDMPGLSLLGPHISGVAIA